MTWAAGVILISKKTKRLALALRSNQVSNPYTFSAIGGFVDNGESPKDTVIREANEEFGLKIDKNNLIPLDKMERIGLNYWLFGYFIDEEIKPQPKDMENIRLEWRYYADWNNIHPKLKQSMNQKHMKRLFSNYSQPNPPTVKGAEESDIMNIECSKCGQINTWYHSYACGGLCLNKECRNHIKNPKHQPYEIDNYCYYESTCDMCEEGNPVASVVWDYGESAEPAGYCLDCLEANPPQEYGDKYKMLPWAKGKEPKYVKEEQEEDSVLVSVGQDDRESIYDILQTFAIVENVESGMTQQQWIGILDEFEQLMPIPKLEMKEENIYDILKTFAIVKNVESGMTQKQWMEMLDEMKESFDFQTKYQAEEHKGYTCEACSANWQEGGLCPMCIIDGIVVCWDCCSREGGHPEFACSTCGGLGARVSELPPNEGAIGGDCISCDGTGIDEQAWDDALEKNAESFDDEADMIWGNWADGVVIFSDGLLLVKVISFPAPHSDEYEGESMWVAVKEGDEYEGKGYLANDPNHSSLKLGTLIEYHEGSESSKPVFKDSNNTDMVTMEQMTDPQFKGILRTTPEQYIKQTQKNIWEKSNKWQESFAAEERIIRVGLVKGRHELPVDNYVFGEIVHSNGFAELILNKLVKEAKQWISRNSYVGPGTVELYITGFTPALTAFIIAWNYMDVDFELIFKHYDNETGDYVSQTYEAEDWATNH